MDVLNKILAKLEELLEAIKKAFKPSVPDTDTPLPKPPVEPPVEPPVQPETLRDPMHPLSILGVPMDKPDGSAKPTELFRGDPRHPMYRPGDGRKIMLVQYALTEGKHWDHYILEAGEVWDLEVPPDHPSIGFTIPKE